MKVVAAVRGLAESPEWKGKFEFIVRQVTSDEGRIESQRIGFGESKHGLVLVDGNGRLVEKLPGHAFGRAEIEDCMKKLPR